MVAIAARQVSREEAIEVLRILKDAIVHTAHGVLIHKQAGLEESEIIQALKQCASLEAAAMGIVFKLLTGNTATTSDIQAIYPDQ